MTVSPDAPGAVTETAAAAGGGAAEPMRIGEAAALAGVSSRTLRWYEELGLVRPSGHSTGGARRYSHGDVDRIVHIRELQSLLGFDLGEIGEVLRGEDELDGLRTEYRSGADRRRRREILVAATAVNERLRGLVQAKLDRLGEMLAELEEKAALYGQRLDELDGGAGPRRAGRSGRRAPGRPPVRGGPGPG